MSPRYESGHASVNGLDMYYEIHGEGGPVVLLHGALGTIATCFPSVLPVLAKTRQVIAVELQGHGHTPDIDRDLSYAQMAADTAALLRELKIAEADFLGYSMGSGVALEIAIGHPELVGKLVLAGGVCYHRDGFYPELLDGIAGQTPEDLVGSQWHEAYLQVAPDPSGWNALVAKTRDMDLAFVGWAPEDVRAIEAPTLLMIGDSDVVRPEHVVQMFRLLGGGVAGDLVGLPSGQLAVLPGTTHATLLERAEWLTSMIQAFLDSPMSER